MSRLIDDLNALHDGYVEAINLAVADDDLVRAERLAAEYDEEAILRSEEHTSAPVTDQSRMPSSA